MQKILGYTLSPFSVSEATAWCLEACRKPQPQLLVTLNPEIIVHALHNARLQHALQAADVHVADGIGVFYAAKLLGQHLPARVPGVELAEAILAQGGESLSVYFLGAKDGVAKQAAENMQAKYGIRVAGVQHGYFDRDNAEEIINGIAQSGAQLLLAGLGEGQEIFLHENRQTLNTPLMIGVGGALDVFSGTVQRTPEWTRRYNLEWAYRVGLDPKRWHRAPRLAKFALLTLQRYLG